MRVEGAGFRVQGSGFRVPTTCSPKKEEVGSQGDYFSQGSVGSLSSEHGTNKTINATFWPWLAGQSS